VLYVGNDMLHDVLPAAAMGFRTALFAGDRRSLRRREGDARVASVTPDVVVLQLRDLLSCVRPSQDL
jgi:putative hydrolase of the HAD superfamily